LSLCSFRGIVGNNDMHLKNFSLYEPSEGEIRLTPAYDLLNVAIVNPADREELALSLNGKKSNLKKGGLSNCRGNHGNREFGGGTSYKKISWS